MSYNFVKKCRLCKCKNLVNVLELSSTPRGDDYLKKKNTIRKSSR